MVLGCEAKVVRCLVFFFNFLVFMAGAVILAGSVAAYVSNPVRQYIMNTVSSATDGESGIRTFKSWDAALFVGMIVGSALLLMGFLGCCGALFEKRALLILFIVLLCALLITQVIIGALLFVFKDDMKKELGDYINKAQIKANTDLKSPECDMLNDLAVQKICCGASGEEKICPSQCEGSAGKKCADEIWKKLEDSALIGGICALVIILLEFAAIIFASTLCCAISGGKQLYA